MLRTRSSPRLVSVRIRSIRSGQAPQVRERAQQLVADHRVPVDRRRRRHRRHRLGRGGHEREVGREDSKRAVEGDRARATARRDRPGGGCRTAPAWRRGPARPRVRRRRSTRTWSARSRASARSSSSGRSAFVHFGDPLDPVAEQADVAAHDRGEDVDDCGLLDRVEPPDRAEVDEPEAAVAEREDVARMRIGVEEPDPQHLLERGAQQLLGERLPVDARGVELRDLSDGEPLELLLHEEAFACSTRCGRAAPARASRDRATAPSRASTSASCRKSSSARRLAANCAEHLARPEALAERRCVAARRWPGARAPPGRAR